ncbi:hypothetical protein BCR34DRAFT_361348 [Clohesyomyces aquaticus]|uniref:Uncharacterized protein n=1 Tax=Clohesyomyces aquaticus TaxID=1231657 RepID=A0A1Y2A848_9PLEO|nr:hypothetical protein BCR34DRAFT_361348 [Clohesyomyces aquaticus]
MSLRHGRDARAAEEGHFEPWEKAAASRRAAFTHLFPVQDTPKMLCDHPRSCKHLDQGDGCCGAASLANHYSLALYLGLSSRCRALRSLSKGKVFRPRELAVQQHIMSRSPMIFDVPGTWTSCHIHTHAFSITTAIHLAPYRTRGRLQFLWPWRTQSIARGQWRSTSSMNERGQTWT